MEHIGRFLEAPPPETLLIVGASGTGKSSLLRTLIPRLSGPRVYLAYRSESGLGAETVPHSHGSPALSLLLVDPGVPEADSVHETGWSPEHLMSFAPASLEVSETLPRPILDAVARMTAEGGGCVVVDSWDASSEQEFRRVAGARASARTLSTTVKVMRSQFGLLPTRTIYALPAEPDAEMLSAADGVIDLGWEDCEGFRLRVMSIPKLRHVPTPETRYLYSLEGGRFYCPPQFAPGFHPPIGPPSPDPEPDEDSLFPGSSCFAEAFGRLAFQGLTGFRVPPRFPSRLSDVFCYPLVAHALAIGGRVVWIPSPSTDALQIVGQLSQWLPPEPLRERLRVVSAGGMDPRLGELSAVVLPVRRGAREGSERRAAIAPGVGPVFPDVFHFLEATPEGRPAVYVLYLDGLHALAALAGSSLNVESFPLVVGSYRRLPRFHGFGFGRSDDPLDQALSAIVDTSIHIEEKYGRTLLLGVRPRTNPYILDWLEGSDRFTLVAMR